MSIDETALALATDKHIADGVLPDLVEFDMLLTFDLHEAVGDKAKKNRAVWTLHLSL